MNICRFSVTHPISVIVLMILLILFGFLNLLKLPIREYPNIEMPTISIVTTYIGASSDIVETKITQPIENAIAGIEGLDNIYSTSKEGKSNIKLEFAIDRNLDEAANDVRDRLNRIINKLPDNADSPIVRKYDASGMPVMMIAITSDDMSSMELFDYTDRYIIDRFSVIDGVASVNIMGGFEQAMRIWLNREQMAARGIVVLDVIKALKRENVEYPSGRIESTAKEYPITIERKYNSPSDFKNIIIKHDENPIRISDIARISIEPKSQRSTFKANGATVITFGISKQSTANTLSISQESRKLIQKLQKNLPKGMRLEIINDDSKFIEMSIQEVFESMIISAVLVFLIVFIFIGSFKAALIPAITVPISLIATCIVLHVCGNSINMLTLLAMVLAVGIVVDDAILVLENIQRHIDNGEPVLYASAYGSRQVLFAVISTTIVLLAVFLPIGMIPGKTGKLFIEFSIAMSAAIAFSCLVSLTLTPMLCSKLLSAQKSTKFNIIVDNIVEQLKELYGAVLNRLQNHKKFVSIFFTFLLVITSAILYRLPGEYEPKEDRNNLMIDVKAQEGIGLYAMQNYMDSIYHKLSPLLDRNIATNILTMIPGFGHADGAINSGMVIVNLVDQSQRKETVFQIIKKINKELKKIPGVIARSILPMGISSKGSYPIQIIIGGYNYQELTHWRNIIFKEVASCPFISSIDCDYKETTPKIRISVDTDRTGDLNISTKTIGATLEAMLGSKRVTTFINRGQEYDVILQADKRQNVDDISNIYVKSENTGQLIPIDNFISITEVGESSKLGRQDRSRSITFSGNVASGYSLSQALTALENIIKEKLPQYAQIYYKGQSKDYKESQGGVLFIFVLAMLIAYFVLAAQFESFVSPFIVMLTVPLGVFGAVMSLYFADFSINIYTQIGLIMLIGLSAKQGILIVEFANQLRDEGIEFHKALIQASQLRLRPIIMTGISTVFGAIPLLLASGASLASRQNLGIVQVFGGISGVILTLLIIPIAYLILNKNEKSPGIIEKELKKQETSL